MSGLFGCLCQFVAHFTVSKQPLLARLPAFLSRKHATKWNAVLRLDSPRSLQIRQGLISFA